MLGIPGEGAYSMWKRALLLLVVFLAGVLVTVLITRRVPPAQEVLDRQFEAMMRGATLAGSSTRLHNDKVYTGEKYVIESATRLTADTWLLKSRLQEGGHDVPLPIPVNIKWAGDTPVIEITDLTLPGMGTYTARVVLYRDQYAGTWSGVGIGGQLFGKILH
jgi:hypothetical protein